MLHATFASFLQVMTNAGQANAATGDQGLADAKETAQLLGQALGVSPDDILLQSTGGGMGWHQSMVSAKAGSQF
jgi:N-acetylglutamate synthase/N-acetylornithine aminotransferase